MKSLNNIYWYLLILLIIFSLPESTKAIINTSTPSKFLGFISYVCEDLPVLDTVDGCNCESGYIYSGDRQFKRDCPCKLNNGKCLCKKPDDKGSLPKPFEQDLPPDPIERTAKALDNDCDASIKSQIEPTLPYKRFKPMSRKELWVLKASWCVPCVALNKELEKLQKRGWKVDFSGDLSSTEKFHIRVIDLDKFEGVPDFFFTRYDGVEGINLPTTVLWEDYKLNKSKTTVGFMDVFAIDKLWGKKD